jgi:spore maturation protein CgeB
MQICILGLSITSSWGNGHATTFRSLAKGLAQRGHSVAFLERDVPWYAEHRDLARSSYVQATLYRDLDELHSQYERLVRDADLTIVGSYVPDGVAIADWVAQVATGVTAFYDIDTPVTLAKLREKTCDYLAPRQFRQFDLYLSFTGGPTLEILDKEYESPRACPLYCSVDPDDYYPLDREPKYDLGYLGTYSPDRQPTLERLMLSPAVNWPQGRFVIAGPQYPAAISWPRNVERIEHLPPHEHGAFYNSQRFTLNVTRADMIQAGYSPSVRLFEAAACGTPIISDWWPGLETLFRPGREILIARNGDEMLRMLHTFPESRRKQLARAARSNVLAQHTSLERAAQLERYFEEAWQARNGKPLRPPSSLPRARPEKESPAGPSRS